MEQHLTAKKWEGRWGTGGGGYQSYTSLGSQGSLSPQNRFFLQDRDLGPRYDTYRLTWAHPKRERDSVRC